MRLQNLFIFFLLLLMTSCEGIIQGNGKIISASNKLPIDSVKINWLSKVVYSDKDGKFSFHEFVGCVPACPDLELVMTKQGYETKYINLTKENEKHRSVFELIPTNNNIDNLSHDKSKDFLFYLSIITAIISLFTLIALSLLKISNKAIWFVIILFGTTSIYYNYLAKVTELKVFRPSLFVFIKWTFEPSWYKLNLPIGLIIFWVCYFYQIKNKRRK
jgi:hypothetical protein